MFLFVIQPTISVPRGVYISRSSDGIGQASDIISQFLVADDTPPGSGQRGNVGVESGTLSEPFRPGLEGNVQVTQLASGEWDRGGGAWWQIDLGTCLVIWN